MDSKSSAFLNQRPFLASFLVALVFFVLSFLVFRIHFLSSDDITVLLVLKGAGNVFAPSALAQRENILLCWVLKELYRLFPEGPWYGALLELAQFLSLWAVFAALFLSPHRGFKVLFFLLGATAVVPFFIEAIQWTVTAALAATGAILLLAAHWKTEAHLKPPAAVLVFFLLTFSIMIRFPAFCLIAFLAVPLVLELLWKNEITPARRSLLIWAGFSVTISLTGAAFSYFYYQRDSQWAEFGRFFDQHFELHETRNPVYDSQTKPVFDSISWTQNDLALFQNWYFLDESSYNVEKLQKLNDYFPKFGINKPSDTSLGEKFSDPIARNLVVFFIVALFFAPRKSRWFLGMAGGWILIVLFLVMTWEKLPDRVYQPALFFMAVQGVFYAVPKWHALEGESGRGFLNPLATWVLGAVLVCATVSCGYADFTFNRFWSYNEDLLRQTLPTFQPKDDELYVVWDSAFPYKLFNAFGDFSFFEHFHILPLTWFQRTPHARVMMERFGVKNLFRDLVDNPKLFLICWPYDVKFYTTYMMEKYGMKTEVEPILTNPFFQVSRVRSAGK